MAACWSTCRTSAALKVQTNKYYNGNPPQLLFYYFDKSTNVENVLFLYTVDKTK